MKIFFTVVMAFGLFMQLLEWSAKNASVAPSQHRTSDNGLVVTGVGLFGLICAIWGS